MPRGRLKSRTYRRVYVRTPGNRTIIHYRRRKPSKAICAKCGEVLKGVPRKLPYIMKNVAKTQKRPQRPFGGVLCTVCSRELIRSNARKIS